MKYTIKGIGERIREKRKEKGLKQLDVSENIHICNTKLSAIENDAEKKGVYAIESIKLKQLFDLSEQLGVDVGYLLGEYESNTQENEFIKNHTKLSEAAIIKLIEIKSLKYGEITKILSKLIENDDFIHLLIDLSDYKENLYEMLSNGENEKMKYELFKMQTSFIRIVDAITELQKNKETLNRRKRLF